MPKLGVLRVDLNSFKIVDHQEVNHTRNSVSSICCGRASGENFARIAGKAWDAADQAGWGLMKEAGVSITAASDGLVDEISAKTGPIEAAWVDAVKERGVDGAQVMKDLRAEIAAQ